MNLKSLTDIEMRKTVNTIINLNKVAMHWENGNYEMAMLVFDDCENKLRKDGLDHLAELVLNKVLEDRSKNQPKQEKMVIKL